MILFTSRRERRLWGWTVTVLVAIYSNLGLARPHGAEVSVVLGIMAACLLVFTRSVASAEEHTHLIEYGVVDVFIYEALTERTRQGRCVPVPGLLTVLAMVLVGLLDESIHYILPIRFFNYRDVLLNVLVRARQWRSRGQPE